MTAFTSWLTARTGTDIPNYDSLHQWSIDHLEDFTGIAKRANADIAQWLIDEFEAKKVDPMTALNERRAELAERQFYIG